MIFVIALVLRKKELFVNGRFAVLSFFEQHRNEEIQTIRQLSTKDLSEYLMKARYAQRVLLLIFSD